MQKDLHQQVQNIIGKYRHKRHFKRIVSVLGCVVTFCTVYALILPAITMEQQNQALNCPLAVHAHAEGCYADGSLICAQADFVVHSHNIDCYDKDEQLVCTLTEVETHEHTDACYRSDPKLICALEEGEAHTHGHTCYETEQTLLCEEEPVRLHSHSEDCYDKDDLLICGSLEVTEHIHTDSCFAPVPSEDTDRNAGLAVASMDENLGEEEALSEGEEETTDESADDPVPVLDSGTCGAQGDNLTWVLTEDGVLTISGTGAMKAYSSISIENIPPWWDYHVDITSVVVEEGVTTIGAFSLMGIYYLTSVELPDSLTSIDSYAFDLCTSLTDIDIPDGVTSIGDYAFRSCTGLTAIDIPDGVTSIGNSAFSGCSGLTSIDIPDGVTSIGNSAFQNCSGLTSIDIPDGVTSIGNSAFSGCSGLTSINIPDGVTSIGSSAFADCSSLTSIDIPDGVTSIGNYAFDGCSGLTSIDIPDGVTSIGSGLFSECSSLTGIDIPDGVTSIGSYTFSGCSGLTSIDIPDGVTSIGNSAFSGCSGLTSINIPDGVTSIGDRAFDGCTGLTSIDIPNGVTSIGSYAFCDCYGLTSIALPDSLTSIGDHAFDGCTGLTGIDIPDGVTSIGSYAFCDCDGLTSISLPDSLISIGNYAFRDCSALTNIDIPDGVTSIGDYAFYGCNNLTSIDIPDGVTSIGNYAFYGCNNLTSIDIPDGVTSIGNYAFYGCSGLTSIDLPDGVTSIGNRAFYNCTGLTSIALPSSLVSIGDYAFQNFRSLTAIDIPDGVTSIGNYAFDGCTGLTSITIPDSVTSIGNYAFRSCSGLTSIDIPDGVTSIGNSAFDGCTGLTSIDIPDGVTSIGSYAFCDCDGLTSIKFPDSLTSIGDSAFYSCTGLTSIKFPDSLTSIGDYAFQRCSRLTSIDIPDGVTSIGSSAFQNCSDLTSIDIPDGVTSIGSSAFAGCNSLTSIDIPDGVTSIGNSAFSGCTALQNILLHTGNFSIGNNLLGSANSFPLITFSAKMDVLNSSVLAYFGSKNVKLEFPNYFAYTGNNSTQLGSVTLIEGSYYVDEYGVLYWYDDAAGTATLVYCPRDTTVGTYSVPETIPAEIGTGTYTVTAIGERAFQDCRKMTAVIIPETVTHLYAYAFYNCTSLGSVNGETDLQKVLAAWASAGANFSTFLNTALWFGGSTAVFPVTTQTLTATDDAGKVITLSTDSAQLLTGQFADSTLTIDRSDTDSTYVTRVYFQSDGGKLGYAFGSHTFDDIAATVCASDDPSICYIEIEPLPAGATLSLNIPMLYENITTGGGDFLIWLETLSPEEKAELGNGVTVPELAHRVTWRTQADTFPLTVAAASGSVSVKGDGTAEGPVYVNGLSFNISAQRSSEFSSYGKDFMTSADYESTFTLPKHFSWREGFLDAVTAGNWTVSSTYDSNTKKYTHGFYVTIDSSKYQAVTLTSLSSALNKLRLEVDNNDNLVVRWSISNPSTTAEMSSYGKTLSFSDCIVADTDAIAAEIERTGAAVTYAFSATGTATQHFTYSDDQQQSASVSKSISVGAADYSLSVYAASAIIMGETDSASLDLKNESSLPYTMLDYVTTTLPDTLYLAPKGLETMFFSDPFGKELTVTIEHATLHQPISRQVTGTDGNIHTVTQQHAGLNTPYSGKCTVDSEGVLDTEAVLTMAWNEDRSQLILTVVSNAGTSTYELAPGTFQSVLDQIGYLVTETVTYTCRWNQRGYTLYSGETRTLDLNITAKDTFMRLTGDQDLYITSSTHYKYYSITAQSFNLSGSAKTSSSYQHCSIYRDVTLDTAAYKGDVLVEGSVPVEISDVLTYKTEITSKNNFFPYTCLPLVHRMNGPQILLVSREDNPNLADEGLGTKNVDGVIYYVLAKEGTYQGVKLGNYLAEQIEVKYTSDGLDTMIRWYLTEFDLQSNVNVEYLSLVQFVNTGTVLASATGTLKNEVWLNDHQTHRLYDEAFVEITLLRTNKFIVENMDRGDTVDWSSHNPKADVLSGGTILSEGDTVTYRMLLEGLGTVTVPGSSLYDQLPLSLDGYWAKDNVKVAYYVPVEGSSVSFQNRAGQDTSGDSFWYLEQDEKNPAQQYLRWSEDFSVTLEGPMYIYVTLTYPSGQQWADYCHNYGDAYLSNTFYVSYLQSEVSHQLVVGAEGLLQKGVVSSGVHNNYSYYNLALDGDHALWYYVNDGRYNGMVNYSITLYNSGDSRFYLSDIQDVLPDGFSYYSASTTSGVTVSDPDNSKIVYKQASVRSSVTTNEAGQKVATFSLYNSTFSSDNLSYDKQSGKYYLSKGEAVVISYRCRTNKRQDTQDIAVNTAAMPYFDYNGAGVQIDPEVSADLATSSMRTNPGTRETMTNSQAALLGFNTENTDDSVTWLTSDVTMYRGDILPGITESAQSPFARTTDTLTWNIQSTNSGTLPMYDYTVTSVMMAPYQFTGAVSIASATCSNWTTPGTPSVLFTFKDRSPGDETVVITTSGGKSIELTVGGGYQEVSVSSSRKIEVKLDRDEDGNEILSIRFPSDIDCIYPGSSMKLTLQTKNFTSNHRNTVLFNTTYLTPSADQPFGTDEVSQGKYVIYNGEDSVVTEANVAVSYGYATTSSTAVSQVENMENTADSTSATNYIVLPEAMQTFQYDLTVNNTGGDVASKAMDMLVMIDSLPQVGDHSPFYEENPRYSEFNVNFADEPNFVVSVNGTALDESQYTLQFSSKTEFSDSDWSGAADSSWISYADLGSLADMRSLRVVINDDTGTLIPSDAVIKVSFHATVDLSDGIPDPSLTAWNNFGYSFSLVNESAELVAAPLSVGVKMPSVPNIVKNLHDSKGNLYYADEDSDFRFVIYEGNPITLSDSHTEAEVFEALSGRKYTVVTLTVPEGDSSSETVSLGDLYCYSYENGSLTQTSDAWLWQNQNWYTILELPLDSDSVYHFGSINTTLQNNTAFSYSSASARTLTCTNIRNVWDLRLEKLCQASGATLPGATFGLYSPLAEDLISETQFAELTADLRNVPQNTLIAEGSDWYLMDIQITDSNGIANWKGLTENSYYLVELQAPDGYLENENPGQKVTNTGEDIVLVTVTNQATYELPTAGGLGMYGYGICGAFLAASSLLVGYKRKRKQSKKTDSCR